MKKCKIFVDGSSRGNPGEAGCAFVIYSDEEKIAEGSKYLGIKTNNEAEYQGLIEGLKKALELGCEELLIFTDSQLLERQIRGVYRVKASNLLPLKEQVIELLAKSKSWKITHIGREFNFDTDFLAKLGSKGGKNEHKE